MYDMHIHTRHSPDAPADATMEAYAERAVSLGYDGIGFTDHQEFDPADEGFARLDYDGYSREIDDVRKKFKGRLSILKGVEISYQSEFSDEPKKYLRGKDFDFVIGAVHFVNRCPFHHGDRYFRGKTPEEAVRPYFAEVLRAAESGLFDVLGHLDHLKRYSIPIYGSYSAEPYCEDIERILRAVIQTGITLEINTSGFRQQSLLEPYPSSDILKKFVRLGGKATTFASDSHGVPHFHQGMEQSIKIARAAGIQSAVHFTSRLRHDTPIG